MSTSVCRHWSHARDEVTWRASQSCNHRSGGYLESPHVHDIDMHFIKLVRDRECVCLSVNLTLHGSQSIIQRIRRRRAELGEQALLVTSEGLYTLRS